MNKAIVIIVIGIVAAGIIFLWRSVPAQDSLPANNVSIVDGVQIIEISAKGGYRPKNSVAEAGLPTILRMKTGGTFDCSLSLRIPKRNVSMFLPQTGTTDIDLGTPEAGTLDGFCSMGMYRFAVEFK
ncbi:MAG: hypothetical protein A3F53_00685 [Candidatus Zambryskibacteria bacterium RIFCSPHIGHO2_12_FULL_48_10]|uniref:EfeO-type cupredoxin-like domain-containing protein n=1 Tax=Candidatus Zambryskibacteria bacterium RIFCSPHIGHO2_01_FULL_46_25 TaxID=1802738 RepID=A0A1G2SZW5_9BACT|nr:MAG: hypothetical protein UX71_C0005G0067 [Parcubacteria group bacterium GW2011_GWA1_47_10]OHA90288.1 MAG: hypothetical protein A2838_01640 [Candidatus Zambryskibacteria bacterium RIFCSPHIGHO2_01_FULL_46_25]OHB01537.1 MAG: hypothetical protein A3F53_00685 [Candidatus Zambryskibacteria bacterium RIFCSPHIGHO2_12_FULL_48_10]OHB06827.1 MAG: hypothetical protein A3A31_00785 [Candidatus Zambryskibacteria bacterium RIFCSPLOWO2_01_FULL_48_25]